MEGIGSWTPVSQQAGQARTAQPHTHANGHTHEQPAASPQDTRGDGIFGRFGLNSILNFFNGRGTSDKLVDGMMAGDTPKLKGASETEKQQLQAELALVDPDILKYASDRGVKLQVVHPGDDLRDARILREKSPDEFRQKLPQMKDFGDKLSRDMDGRDAELARLRDELAALVKKKGINEQPGNLQPGPPDKEVETLNKKIFDAERDKSMAVWQSARDSKLPVKPYGLPSSPGMMGLAFSHMASMPTSIEHMAATHGARTPEEKQEFQALVEGINGDRLKTARAESLKHWEGMLSKTPEGRKHLETMRKHPEQIPIDHRKHDILVPDLFYTRRPEKSEFGKEPPPPSPDDKPLRLDEHDFATLQQWQDEHGKVDISYDKKTGQGNGVLGQYFPYGDVNRILVRHDALGPEKDTATHEVGHAIDFLVEKDDPNFYKPWSERLKTAFENVNKPNGTEAITEYSRTNPREYLAEGFAAFHHDPKALQAKDPALYQLVAELNQRAAELGQGK